MNNLSKSFIFETVGTILNEWGGANKLGDLLVGWGNYRNILIITDKGLHDGGVLTPIISSLQEKGINSLVFDGVVADPPESIVLECVKKAQNAQIDLVIGLGGGSSMDVAKVAAVLLCSKQNISALYGIGKVTGGRLPLIQIPTTAGTGSEVTNVAIISVDETTKMGVVARQLYADKVILDAQLTVGLPALQTAATGIDAMVHAIEAFTSKIKKNPLSDMLACEALRLLSNHIVQACHDGKNRRAREAMLLGATLAGQAFSNAPVAAVHALAYPLGGHYHLAHGLTNALMLVPVLRFNMAAAAPYYAQLGTVLGGKATSAEQGALWFIEQIDHLIQQTGCPRRLRDVGVNKDSLPLLARDAMKQQRLLINNPVDITESIALSLYLQAF